MHLHESYVRAERCIIRSSGMVYSWKLNYEFTLEEIKTAIHDLFVFILYHFVANLGYEALDDFL